MLELRLNNDVITRLRKAQFYPDTMLTSLMTLICLYKEDTALLDTMDDSSTSKRAMLVYYDLLRKGYIEEDTREETTIFYRLSDKGKNFVEEIRAAMPTIIQADEPVVVSSDNVEDWIGEWINLFPSGVVTGGKLVKSDKKSCLIKMRKFLKDYPEYDRDTIFKATSEYLQQFENNAELKMKCAVYFIEKRGEGSALAEWCSRIKESPAMSDSFIHSTGLI